MARAARRTPAAPRVVRLYPYFALGALGAIYMLMAALAATPDSRIVPAASGSSAGWLLGPLQHLGVGIGSHSGAPLLFFLALVVSFGLYLVVLAGAGRLSLPVALGAVAVFHVLFAVAPALLSSDVFSYIGYARLEAVHGLNPYAYTPADASSDPVFGLVGWKDSTSAYGPLFTLITYPIGKITVAVAYWIMKAVAAAASLVVVALVWLIARKLGRPPLPAALFVGLNPLVLVHVVGGAHNDAVAVALGVGGMLALVVCRGGVGAGLGVMAATVKASLGILAAFVVLGAPSIRRALLTALVTVAAVVGVTTAVYGFEAVSALAVVGENQARTSFYSLPNQTSRALAVISGQPARDLLPAIKVFFVAAYLMLLAWLVRRTIRDSREWLKMAGWAMFGLLVATAWLLPWYVIWLLPLAAVAGDRRLMIAALAITAYMLPIRIPL